LQPSQGGRGFLGFLLGGLGYEFTDADLLRLILSPDFAAFSLAFGGGKSPNFAAKDPALTAFLGLLSLASILIAFLTSRVKFSGLRTLFPFFC
jgi:hypothetical protein